MPGRGGHREGKPGTAYPNRTDLNAPKAPVMRLPGQEYGVQAAQVAQQQAVPAMPAPDWSMPPPPVDLHAPTTRPNEPVTHGLPSGPGAGPEVLGMGGGDDTLSVLRAAYAKFPNADLMRLINQEAAGGS